MKAAVNTRFTAIGASSPIPFSILYADGTRLRSGTPPNEFSIHFKTSRSQWRATLMGHIGLLEGYFDQEIEFDGDISALFRLGLDAAFDTANPLVAIRNQWGS